MIPPYLVNTLCHYLLIHVHVLINVVLSFLSHFRLRVFLCPYHAVSAANDCLSSTEPCLWIYLIQAIHPTYLCVLVLSKILTRGR